jgi:hypothetical protein
MPDLDLGNIAEIDLTRPIRVSAAVLEAGARLLAFMTWPNDDTRRRQYLAHFVAAAISVTESPQPDPVPLLGTFDQFLEANATIKQILLDDYLLPLGGFELLAESPGKQVLTDVTAELQRGWFVASMILISIRMIADNTEAARGGASVRKAIDLIERLGPDAA